MDESQAPAILPVELKLETTEEHVARLYTAYWQTDAERGFIHRVSDLSSQFNVPSHRVARIVTEASNAFSREDFCSSCGTPYIFSSRSDFQMRSRNKWPWQCNQCKLGENQRRDEKAVADRKRYQELINDRYNSGNSGPLDPTELSFETAVYFISFCRLCATEDFRLAVLLESIRRRLSPTADFDFQILSQLNDDGLLKVNPQSSLDAFVGETAERFYPKKVVWNLPFGVWSENPKDFASELEEILRGDGWPDSWRDSRLTLWEKVSLEECLQYLAFTLGEHQLSINPGEKTRLVFTNILKDFSVAQIYGFIWRAAKDAAAFYVREHVTKQHAANTVVGAIQRQADRAKAEGWEIRPYGRVWNCPQSMLSEVLFNSVLGIGDDGFNRCPSITYLSRLTK